jgi:hypothetical protein
MTSAQPSHTPANDRHRPDLLTGENRLDLVALALVVLLILGPMAAGAFGHH